MYFEFHKTQITILLRSCTVLHRVVFMFCIYLCSLGIVLWPKTKTSVTKSQNTSVLGYEWSKKMGVLHSIYVGNNTLSMSLNSHHQHTVLHTSMIRYWLASYLYLYHPNTRHTRNSIQCVYFRWHTHILVYTIVFGCPRIKWNHSVQMMIQHTSACVSLSLTHAHTHKHTHTHTHAHKHTHTHNSAIETQIYVETR